MTWPNAAQHIRPEWEEVNHLPEIRDTINRLHNTLTETVQGHSEAIKRTIDGLLDDKNWPKTKAPYDLNSSMMILNALTDENAQLEKYYDISLYVLLNLLQDETIDKIWARAKFQALDDSKLLYLMIFVFAYIQDETEEWLIQKLKNIWIPANKIQALLSQARAESQGIRDQSEKAKTTFIG